MSFCPAHKPLAAATLFAVGILSGALQAVHAASFVANGVTI